METYSEIQPWGKTLYTIQPNTYTCFTTEHQKVELLTNPHFGRMLFLNGTLQSTSSDEGIYHGALVNAATKGGRKLGRVLIAGGAEGWLAKRVLAAGASQVVMVDWDRELVAHCRDSESWASEIWNDPRFLYSSKSIITYCEETSLSFDTIFLDLLDFEEMGDSYGHILKWIENVKDANCVTVMNIGRDRLIANKEGGTVIEILVPSFQEPWYLVRKENV